MAGLPTLSRAAAAMDAAAAGLDMHRLIADLYPFCRSLTGDGVRRTLDVLREHIRLERYEVPSGTPVFDWTVPNEWNVRDAYVRGPRGDRVIDLSKSNLHVVGYSRPVRARVSLEELKAHLFTLPDRPEWIPYRTAYYEDTWGFCLSHAALQRLEAGEYEVCIDASLEPGHLAYGESVIPGRTTDEVLVSAHICHPSLCNDNLSGIALAVALASLVARSAARYTYRFLFIPGTIGSITWLARNEAAVSRIKHGLVLAGVGDPGRPTYKRSRRGDAEIDRVMAFVLGRTGDANPLLEFSPWGYDERQFCSPGFDLPVGCFMRSIHGRYPEYHTSADDLAFVTPEALADSFARIAEAFAVLEANRVFRNLSPKCEPQLGRRGLYAAIGGVPAQEPSKLALLWVLNLSDGRHSLLDVAARSGLPFQAIRDAADLLVAHGLLAEATDVGSDLSQRADTGRGHPPR